MSANVTPAVALWGTLLTFVLTASPAHAEPPPATPWVHSLTPVESLYVAPHGSGDGKSSQSPMSFARALREAKPGQLFWMLAGQYRGDFRLSRTGTAERPIVFRAAPGQRATILGTISIDGAHNWLWGMELIDRRHKGRAEYATPSVTATAPGAHIINNIIHDSGGGIGGWASGPNHVYYGNIIYGMGGDLDPPRIRTNYPTYTQNNYDRDGYKYFVQNMFFDGRPFDANFNFHAYTQAGLISGFYLKQNVFSNGLFLIGGYNEPHHHEVLLENFFHNTSAVRFGYRRPIQVQFRGNYLVGSALQTEWFWGVGDDVRGAKPLPNVYTENEVYAPPGGRHISLRTVAYVKDKDGKVIRSEGVPRIESRDIWDNNIYSQPLLADLHAGGKKAGGLDLAGWRQATSAAGRMFDANARVVPLPTQAKVAVLANEYEPGRGHVVIVNWRKEPSVVVDLAPIVAKGARFTVHWAKRAFDSPLIEGTYSQPVSIPAEGRQFCALLVRSRRLEIE